MQPTKGDRDEGAARVSPERVDFNLADAIAIDPDSEQVKVIFSQEGPSPLYEATLAPGSFTQAGSSPKTIWKFLDKESAHPGAVGLHKVTLTQTFNKLKDLSDGKGVQIPISTTALGAPPIKVRESIRIGDDCATQILTCTQKIPGVFLLCNSTPAP